MSVPESSPDEQQGALFGEASDTVRMTYRERRERKAERLRDWAAKRDSDASAVFQAHEKYRGDHAFNFQPGHIPERERVIAREERAFESARKASEMASRADEIERQAAQSIYSDDPDAIERLEMKLRCLEGQRSDAKAYNAACRKAAKRGEAFAPELEAAPAWIRREVGSLAQIRRLSAGGGLPSYVTTNLGGNITRTRQRLEQLKRERDHGPADRIILAKYSGECADCGAKLERGQTIRYNRQAGARCMECER